MPDGATEISEHAVLEAYGKQGYVMGRQETVREAVGYSLSKDGNPILKVVIDKSRDMKLLLGTGIPADKFVELTQEYFRRVNEQVPDYPFDNSFETKDFISLSSPDSDTLFMYWPNQSFGPGKPSKIEVTVPNKRLNEELVGMDIHLAGFVESAGKDIPRDLIKIVVSHALDARAGLISSPRQ